MSFHRDRVLVALFVLVLLLSFQRSAPSQTLNVEAAKKEGKLVAYGTIVPKVMEPVHRGFEKKYGIKVEYWRANATQVVERALSEWQAGRPDFDLTFAIHGAQVLLKAHGVYAKYSPPSAEMFPAISRTKTACLWPGVTRQLACFTILSWLSPASSRQPSTICFNRNGKVRSLCRDASRHTSTAQFLVRS